MVEKKQELYSLLAFPFPLPVLTPPLIVIVIAGNENGSIPMMNFRVRESKYKNYINNLVDFPLITLALWFLTYCVLTILQTFIRDM